MAISLAIILFLGILVGLLLDRLKLPKLLGFLLLGILLGPYVFNILSEDLLIISSDLRRIALIVILLKAGLGINKDDLIKVGKPAIKLSFLPGLLEGCIIIVLSMLLLDFSIVQGGLLGFILAAVSPAVVVPSMLYLMDAKLGTNKGIPTLILASASIDDVIAITIFSSFLSMYSGTGISIPLQLLGIPVSILLGIGIGIIGGLLLIALFKRLNLDATRGILFLLGCAILVDHIGEIAKEHIEIAVLLGIMTIGFILAEKLDDYAHHLKDSLTYIWVFAEIMLFVLVGAEVNIAVAIDAGVIGIIIILGGLIARSLGVYLSLIGTNLNSKEKSFCMLAYTPKATVQAAMGGIPLALGVVGGELILAIAVLSILITAPLGALLINKLAPKLLSYS